MRWWRMRPASHMPEAEMMTLGDLSRFSALDSSLLSVMFSPGNWNRAPPFSAWMACSSR